MALLSFCSNVLCAKKNKNTLTGANNNIFLPISFGKKINTLLSSYVYCILMFIKDVTANELSFQAEETGEGDG